MKKIGRHWLGTGLFASALLMLSTNSAEGLVQNPSISPESYKSDGSEQEVESSLKSLGHSRYLLRTSIRTYVFFPDTYLFDEAKSLMEEMRSEMPGIPLVLPNRLVAKKEIDVLRRVLTLLNDRHGKSYDISNFWIDGQPANQSRVEGIRSGIRLTREMQPSINLEDLSVQYVPVTEEYASFNHAAVGGRTLAEAGRYNFDRGRAVIQTKSSERGLVLVSLVDSERRAISGSQIPGASEEEGMGHGLVAAKKGTPQSGRRCSPCKPYTYPPARSGPWGSFTNEYHPPARSGPWGSF